jgi:hypothetical protein
MLCAFFALIFIDRHVFSPGIIPGIDEMKRVLRTVYFPFSGCQPAVDSFESARKI